MLLTAERAHLDLADDEVAHLTDARDTRLEVTDGFVWITIDGDREDVVLRPGESFVVDSADPVTVSALRGAAALEVRAHAGVPHPGRPRTIPRHRLDRLFAGVTLSSSAVA